MRLFKFIRRIYNYHFSAKKNFVRSLTNTLGFVPAHVHFYERAFTHKSANPEQDNSDESKLGHNNERLEFLGDAMLGAVIAEYLFRKYPTQDEGFMTKMRSKVVNRKIMNDIADQMELDVFLKHCGVPHISRTMLGNALEAFLGAIYLDVGYGKTKRFIIRRLIQQHIDVHLLEKVNYNFKSQLLEYCQKHQKSISYKLLKRFKRNHRERFSVAVLVNEERLGTAEHYSKKGAEQEASKKALLKLGLISKADLEQMEDLTM